MEAQSLTVWVWHRHEGIFSNGYPLTQLIYEAITTVFVEQPLALPGSANYI